MAIFSSRLLNGQPPVIFEDGLQSRDFVHISDIVQANLLAMEPVALGRRSASEHKWVLKKVCAARWIGIESSAGWRRE